MDPTLIAFGLVSTVFGILFAMGRVHVHTGAWKAMTEEERAGIRIRPLCRNIGEVIALSGLIFLLYGVFPGFRAHMFTVAIIAWLAVACADIFWIGKSGRYVRKEPSLREGANARKEPLIAALPGNRRKER